MDDTRAASADRPRSLLAVVAHPRDADRALGAIVTHWVGQGTEAWLAGCTSVDGRSDEATTDPLALAAEQE